MVGTNFLSAIGGEKGPPQEVWSLDTKPQVKALTKFGLGTINTLAPASAEAAARSKEAQTRNDALLQQQAGIWQGLLNKPMLDPLATYGAVGDKLFSYIQPNVLDPIANFAVNRGRADDRALLGTNGPLFSTSSRLRDAARSNQVWLDVAKSIIPQINPGFNQVFNAGLASDAADVNRAGFIPQLMSLNQSNALSPYNPVMAQINAWNALSSGFGNQGTNTALNRTGFLQKQNGWDRAGAATDAIMSRVGQVASLYGSLGGGGMGSGEGGGGGAPTSYYGQVGGPGAAPGTHVGNVNTPGTGWN